MLILYRIYTQIPKELIQESILTVERKRKNGALVDDEKTIHQ